MSILVAILLSLAVWGLHRLRSLLLVVGLVGALVVAFVALTLRPSTSPITNLVVLVVAVTAGMLLGRLVPARAMPMLTLLAALAVADVVWVGLTLGFGPEVTNAARDGWWAYTMLAFDTPWTRTSLGIGDLLLIAAIVEHARRRGRSLAMAATAAALGLLLANLTFAVAWPGNLALVPFLLFGWLAAEGFARLDGARGQRNG